jgi:hypothetical protein
VARNVEEYVRVPLWPHSQITMPPPESAHRHAAAGQRRFEHRQRAQGQARPGAWVAELTGLLDLSGWPAGMRVIARKERRHPDAQLRFTDIGGHRFTCFVTNAKTGQLADLELRHRRRAGARTASATPKIPACAASPCTALPRTRSGASWWRWPVSFSPGCRCLPWTIPPGAWEPKRLRLRLFPAAGRLIRSGRRTRMRLAANWPWATLVTAAITRLQALTPG